MKQLFFIPLVFIAFQSHSSAILQDYYPLAVGNWWEYKTKTGSQRYEITGADLDSFVFEITTRTSADTAVDIKKVLPNDSMAMFYHGLTVLAPDFIWLTKPHGPHFALPTQDSLTTPAGVFHKTHTYATFCHGAGCYYNIVSPGIGCAGKYLTYFSSIDTFARLDDYNITKTPSGYDYSCKKANQGLPDSSFSCNWINDSADIQFRTPGHACSKFMTITSCNTIKGCLRVYISDTAGSPCAQAQKYDHTVKVENLTGEHSYLIKVFNTWFEEFDLKTDLLYQSLIKKNTANWGDRAIRGTKPFTISCRPNPFNTNVTIRIANRSRREVGCCWINIFDLQGNLVKTLSADHSLMSALTWHGTDNRGRHLPNAMYYLKINSGNRHLYSGKVMLRR